jgi:hypothetical protein
MSYTSCRQIHGYCVEGADYNVLGFQPFNVSNYPTNINTKITANQNDINELRLKIKAVRLHITACTRDSLFMKQQIAGKHIALDMLKQQSHRSEKQ